MTNLDIWEILNWSNWSKKLTNKILANLVLDNSDNGPLYSTMINGAYFMLPGDMSFYQVQQMIKYVFEPNVKLKDKEKVKVEIQNGTKIEGLAYSTSLDFKKQGLTVLKISNAPDKMYAQTIIYDLTNGQKPMKHWIP